MDIGSHRHWKLAAGVSLGLIALACAARGQTTGQSIPPPRTTLNQPAASLSKPPLSGGVGQVVATSARLDAARPPFAEPAAPAPASLRTRIKDVASIEGIRDNQLI